MSITRTDANGNIIYNIDPSGNEIGQRGKWLAGILLASVTLFTIIVIVAHWPDRMPPVNSNAGTKYQYKWFAITYLDSNGKDPADTTIFQTPKTIDTPMVIAGTNTDSLKRIKDSIAKQQAAIVAPSKKRSTCTIDLNTLLLLLVALSGFLGNMIHIASSLTNFIGAGKFKRSWLLWYWVKPFTAAALAVGVYIIFRAGFLNSADATASVNLYGVVAIALLAGLFTDMATQKLKDVFAVVFQSGTVRPNPLDYPPLKITSITPARLPLDQEIDVVVSGVGFENRILKIKIDGEEIKEAVIQPNSIVFKYKAGKDKPKPQLIIYDDKGVEITKYDLLTISADEPATTVSVTDISPVTLVVNTETEINITGMGLDTATLVIKAGDNTIPDSDIIKTADSIKFKYLATAAGNIDFVVLDDKGNELIKKTITAA
jgi:hypothetical protein